MRYVVDDSPSLIGRITAAVVAFLFAALTTVAVPWYLAWKFPIKFFYLIPMVGVFALHGFYCWAFLIAVAALAIGFIYGFSDTLEIFNLMWGTGESTDPELIKAAQDFRIFIPLTGLVSFLLLAVAR